MKTRKMCLPPGWYPRSAEQIEGFLKPFAGDAGGADAAIAPHAGWHYSGAVAARAAAALAGEADTVAVIGGHLGEGFPPLFALEDAAETPLGAMEIDGELRDDLFAELGGREDARADNTVEVLLPMAKYFFPRARLLWARFPLSPASFDAGRALARAAKRLGRRLKVLGSTDLTHYGPNYGFYPRGLGERGLAWVKEENDRRFIDAVLAGDPAGVLARAKNDLSSCSAGAVAGVLGFAAESSSGKPRLLCYATSADIALKEEGAIPDSFVGYGAFAF